MYRKASSFIIALALFAVAGLALAQNADKNSAGPTKNDLKIRVMEPQEGATITGSTLRVAVDYDRARFREQGAVDKGLDKFPPPDFDVFVDGSLKQTLKSGVNVATIDNLTPGSHKITILAKNISGEVIDRKEIGFTTVEAMAATTTSTSATTERMSAPVPPPPAPAPAYQPSAPSASYQPAPAPPAPMETTLPKTASPAPRLALLGLALLASGVLIGRKAL